MEGLWRVTSEMTVTLGLVLALAAHCSIALVLRQAWKLRWHWPITYVLVMSTFTISTAIWPIPFFSMVVWPQ